MTRFLLIASVAFFAFGARASFDYMGYSTLACRADTSSRDDDLTTTAGFVGNLSTTASLTVHCPLYRLGQAQTLGNYEWYGFSVAITDNSTTSGVSCRIGVHTYTPTIAGTDNDVYFSSSVASLNSTTGDSALVWQASSQTAPDYQNNQFDFLSCTLPAATGTGVSGLRASYTAEFEYTSVGGSSHCMNYSPLVCTHASTSEIDDVGFAPGTIKALATGSTTTVACPLVKDLAFDPPQQVLVWGYSATTSSPSASCRVRFVHTNAGSGLGTAYFSSSVTRTASGAAGHWYVNMTSFPSIDDYSSATVLCTLPAQAGSPLRPSRIYGYEHEEGTSNGTCVLIP